jgi:hypothetical protein
VDALHDRIAAGKPAVLARIEAAVGRRRLAHEVGHGELHAVGTDQHVFAGQRLLHPHADDGAPVVGPDPAAFEQHVVHRVVHLVPWFLPRG